MAKCLASVQKSILYESQYQYSASFCNYTLFKDFSASSVLSQPLWVVYPFLVAIQASQSSAWQAALDSAPYMEHVRRTTAIGPS